MISAVEHGAHGISLDVLERVCRALDGSLIVELRAPLTIGRIDQRDAGHAACTAAVRKALERLGYACATEHPFSDGRVGGWIDLLAFDPVTGRLLIVEVKTELCDLGGLQRQVAWYERMAPTVARRLGWRARTVQCLVVILATDANDAALDMNRATIDRVFPVRGRALRVALESRGSLRGWGLILVDPRRRGGRAWLGLRLDGRRGPAPYRSYADFMSHIRARRRTDPTTIRASSARRPMPSTSRGMVAGRVIGAGDQRQTR
jgi:hypothetical protein